MKTYMAIAVSICNYHHFVVTNVHQKMLEAPSIKEARSKARKFVGSKNGAEKRRKRNGRYKPRFSLHCILQLKKSPKDKFGTMYKIVKAIPAQ